MDVTSARLAAAGALRRLGHALVSRHVSDEVLEKVATLAGRLSSRVEASAPRSRQPDALKRRLFGTPPAAFGPMDHFPDCIVSGQANPLGVAMRVHREGEEAVARAHLGAAFEGAPGRAHGGIVAAIFDDTMGFVLSMLHTPAFTGELTVAYLAPTPVGVEVEFRARLRERIGRKLYIDADATCAGTRLATATGLFIVIPPERLGLPPTYTGSGGL